MTQKEKEYLNYLEDTLVHIQETEMAQNILDDIEGMDLDEAKEYIKSYIKK